MNYDDVLSYTHSLGDIYHISKSKLTVKEIVGCILLSSIPITMFLLGIIYIK